jgi:hypothetical protein
MSLNVAVCHARLKLLSLPSSGPGWLILALATSLCGCHGEPFPHVQVRGTVSYEDGSRIPADQIILRFEPQIPPKDAKTFPRPGLSYVTVKDGTFDTVTTHKHGDGLVKGQHRVLVVATGTDSEGRPVVPAEYADSATTPLLVHTEDSPFHLKIRRP